MQLPYIAEAMKISGVLILALLLVAAVRAAAALSTPNVLYSSSGAEGVLKAGNSLHYGDYRLRLLDTDCWLILYGKYMRPLLVVSAGSLGIKDCYLTLDSAGTLFIYGYRDSKLVEKWSSRDRSRIGSYAFVLKYDGTLNIYGPELWKSSNTQFSVSTSNHSDSMSSTTASSTNAASLTVRGNGWTWWPGKNFSIGTIISTNDYKLELLDYCIMVMTNTRTGKVVWSTNVWGTVGDCYLRFETNGELMIKEHSGSIIWRSGVRGRTGLDYVLSIRPDGVLVVYNPPIKTWTPKMITQVAWSGGEKIDMVTDQPK